MRNKNKAKNREFIDSAILNDLTYQDYLERLTKIALSMFEWVNLPDTMNERWLEECLFYYGSAALLYDDKLEYINTQASTNGQVNIYGIPTALNCYSYGYQSNRLNYTGLAKPSKDKGCVYVLNNYDKTPTITHLQLFALRLYECQRTWDTNIRTQKFPYIIACTQDQKITIENMYSQVDGNKPCIIVDKDNIDLNTIKCINTNAPFIADKLTKEKKEIWNEVLTYLGINNIDIEKKERMVSAETEGNNELINLNLESFLVPRQYACKLFNQLFDLPENKQISVRVRSDLHNVIKEVLSSTAEIKDDYNMLNNESGDNNE